MKLRYLLLVIFSLVTAVPLVLFWIWPHSQSMTNELEDVRERHLLFAETLGISLENYHREATATFRLIHTNLVGQGRVEGAGDLLQDLHFRNICVFDTATRELRLGVTPRSTSSRRARTTWRSAHWIPIHWWNSPTPSLSGARATR